jgi:hypothetical protein
MIFFPAFPRKREPILKIRIRSIRKFNGIWGAEFVSLCMDPRFRGDDVLTQRIGVPPVTAILAPDT